MIHSTFKKLMIPAQLAIALSISGTYGMQEETVNPSVVAGSHFSEAFNPENLKAIESFREFYRQHGNGGDDDIALVEPHPFLAPWADALLQTMNKGKQDDNICQLAKEVEAFIGDKKVSAYWLVDIHFRYLTLLQEMSPDEKDLFKHIPYNRYLMGLIEKDISGKPVILDIVKWAMCLKTKGEHFYDTGHNTAYFNEISEESWHQINQEVSKGLPALIVYPALGKGVFPVDLLIKCWFDEIYLMGMPTSGIKNVHGEDSSPIGFAFHDLFHYKTDSRRTALYNHIARTVSELVQNGAFASDVIPVVVKASIQKYQLILETLRRGHESLEGNKLAQLGEFIALHELLYFPDALLDMTSPTDLIKAMTVGSIAEYDSFGVWENPADPLVTSPVTGKSMLAERDIRELAISMALADESFPFPYELHYITDPEERLAAKHSFLKDKTRFKVESSRQFIDAQFELPSGKLVTYAVPTLVRKYRNLEASLDLLKMGGVEALQRPVLSGTDAQDRESVIKTLENVKHELILSVQSYGSTLRSFFENHESEFAKKHQAITEVEKAALTKLFQVNNQ